MPKQPVAHLALPPERRRWDKYLKSNHHLIVGGSGWKTNYYKRKGNPI